MEDYTFTTNDKHFTFSLTLYHYSGVLHVCVLAANSFSLFQNSIEIQLDDSTPSKPS